MGTIKIIRSKEFINLWKDYEIYIDNIKVGDISNGKTKAFNVAPGQHSLYSKSGWFSGPKILLEVSGEQIKIFRLEVFQIAKWSCITAILILLLSWPLDHVYGFIVILYAIIPILAWYLYFSTIGRKKYLTLIDISEDHQSPK